MHLKCVLTTILTIVCLIAGSSTTIFANIYTWEDETGVQHFSNEPPLDPQVEARVFIVAEPYVRPPDDTAYTIADPAGDTAAADFQQEAAEAPSDPASEAPPLTALEDPVGPESDEVSGAGPALGQASTQTTHRKVVVINRHRPHTPSFQDHQRRLRHRFSGHYDRVYRHRDSERVKKRYHKPYRQPHVSGRHLDSRRNSRPTARERIGEPRHRWLPMLVPPAERHRPRHPRAPGRR